MGSVSIDIKKRERPFEQLNLSEKNVIQYLIEYRDSLDPFYGAETDNDVDYAGVVKGLNQELTALYSYLDILISKCKFTPNKREIIKLLSDGHDEHSLFEMKKIASVENFSKEKDRIYYKIKEENDRQWKKYIHKQYLDTYLRVCNVCGKELPLTKDFYRKNINGSLGFRRICKKCSN